MPIQISVFQAFDYIGWIGKVRYVPGHLAPEVFADLRNLSIPGSWGWKPNGIVCFDHLISHNHMVQYGIYKYLDYAMITKTW